MNTQHRYYILDGRTPVPCSSTEEFYLWFGSSDNLRRVDNTYIGDVNISTVFLGVNHQWFFEGDPLLFETMIFGGEHDGRQWRCSTWEEAEEQHKQACLQVETHN